jgi:hypothetical protein
MVASLLMQINQLQEAILAGDWAAATKHVCRLDLQGTQALQVGAQTIVCILKLVVKILNDVAMLHAV